MRLICIGPTNANRPAEVVGVSKTRGQGPLHVSSGEPERHIGVSSHAALQAPGEAREFGGGVIGLGGRGEGLLMINLPEDEEGHAGLAL